ncbi:MAG: AAA family ATPase [Polyangiaceae bacterium]|nr:AAA family ATPase [Polyangiaceae bacterium]
MTPTEARESVSVAFKSFEARRKKTANEATTRVELIDEILRSVGWPTGSIERELPTGTGDFIDYELRADGQAWMIVEAKRVGENFRLTPKSARSSQPSRSLQSLTGTGGETLRDVLKQAARYCNERGIALACATNGFEWIFFRGLSTPTRPWTKGHAVVFGGHDDIVGRFDEFLACIGRASAGSSFLHERLELPPTGMLPPSRVPQDVLTFVRKERDPNATALVRNISDFLFSEIFGERRGDMLTRCYVEPGSSEEFERSIHRLLKDSETVIDEDAIHAVPTDAEKFVAHVDRHEATGAKQPVVVVGNVGVGKTTFLQRSLAQLRSDRSAICAVVDLEGFGHGGGIDGSAEQARVADEVLNKLQTATLTVLKHREDLSDAAKLQGEHSSRETLSTLQLNKLQNTKRLGRELWVADPTAWPRKEMEIFEELTSKPVTHLVAYIRHLHGRFTREDDARYPILIAIDNLDLSTDEYQHTIYGLAQRLTRDTNAIVVVCLREDTFRLGREPGGFLTSSAFPFVFHVARPPLDQLLRKRVTYGEYAKENALLPRGLKTEGERVVDVCKLVRTTLLVQKSESLELFAGLAGHNTRAALDLVRALVDGAAPGRADSSATYAFECLLNSSGYETLQARVVNCFDAEPAGAPAHALQMRLLAYYSFAVDAGPERVLFEEVDRAIANFSGWGYPVALVRWSLENLVKNGLLRDPKGGRRQNQTLSKRLNITASGHVHLNRLVDLRSYRAAVASTTRWYDPQLAESFIRSSSEAAGAAGLTIGDIVESKAIDVFDAYLAQSVTREDRTLATGLGGHRWRAEVLSRSARILPPQYQPVPLPIATSSEPTLEVPSPRPRQQKEEQLKLALGGVTNELTLKKIHRDVEYKDTVWTPRILWALEFAKRRHLGPQRASDLAELLVRYGDIDVPRNNVARAFRDFRPEHGVDGLWTVEKKRYAITDAGALLLTTLLSDDSE